MAILVNNRSISVHSLTRTRTRAATSPADCSEQAPSGPETLSDVYLWHEVCSYLRSALVSEVPLNEQTQINGLAGADFRSARAGNRSFGDKGWAPARGSNCEAGPDVDAKRAA